MPEPITQPEPVRHGLSAEASFLRLDAMEAEGELQLGNDVEVRQKSGRLSHPAAVSPLGRKAGDVDAVGEDPPGIGRFQTGEEPKRGGLAAA